MKLTHVRLLTENFKECFLFYRDILGFDVDWGIKVAHFRDPDDNLVEIYEAIEMD